MQLRRQIIITNGVIVNVDISWYTWWLKAAMNRKELCTAWYEQIKMIYIITRLLHRAILWITLRQFEFHSVKEYG